MPDGTTANDGAAGVRLDRWVRRSDPAHAFRPYQIAPARAIAESIRHGQGHQLAAVFSRQSGKDEMLAQLLAWLLRAYWLRGGGAVVAAPTLRPQAMISRDRLLDRVRASSWPPGIRVRDGYIVEAGHASVRFLSAARRANARGQTANLLLVANEAQDIEPDVWDAVFDPMAASTNATTLFLGTVWSRDTLLARQMRYLAEREHADGRQRIWRVDWQTVAASVPAYGERVREKIAQFGELHPFIRTEYCLEELDGDEGLFPVHRIAALRGDHPRRHEGESGHRYALLIDVAGEEESGSGLAAYHNESRRDSTALTVVEVVPAPLDPSGNRPVYHVVDRMAWTGVRHTTLHTQIAHLARAVWRAEIVVVDATGIGTGLASFLEATLGDRRGGRAIRVEPFTFTQQSKSQLGWDLVALIDQGRLREYRDDSHLATPAARLTARFWAELRATTFQVLPGAGRMLRWSVPTGRGHDDLVMSLALVPVLDRIDWRPRRAVGRSED